MAIKTSAREHWLVNQTQARPTTGTGGRSPQRQKPVSNQSRPRDTTWACAGGEAGVRSLGAVQMRSRVAVSVPQRLVHVVWVWGGLWGRGGEGGGGGGESDAGAGSGGAGRGRFGGAGWRAPKAGGGYAATGVVWWTQGWRNFYALDFGLYPIFVFVFLMFGPYFCTASEVITA